MCGICGIFNYGSRAPVDRADLERMNRTMVHRGPDDEGYHVDGPVGLAMRRLAIVDPAGGHQPLSSEDDEIWAVVNGEIYNFPELRQELTAKGHVFKTRSDAEVAVHLYQDHGPKFVDRLEGMFGLALWDRTEQRLFLARDHLGIKPLFFHDNGQRIVFGSEIKTVRALCPGGAIDPTALSNYLSFLYIPGPETIYDHIKRLEPGCLTAIDQAGSSTRRYWRMELRPDFGRTEAQTLDQLEAHLDRAVTSHLMSDVPLGAFLSGGLDSSLVVSAMARQMAEPVKTFTIGFEERSFDETPEAALIAAALGTDHRAEIMAPQPELMLDRLTDQFDEPFADYGAIPLYLVSQLARQKVTVALTGDGGDELFGGYPTYYAPIVRDLYALIPRALRQGFIDRLIDRLPTSFDRVSFDFMAKRFVGGVDLPPAEGHFHWKAVFDADDKRALLQPDVLPSIPLDAPLERYRALFAEAKGGDRANRLMSIDCHHFLIDNILAKSDRMSMAHSLEVRVPLLDKGLVEFAATVPGPMKVRLLKTKRLFRKLAQRRLPPSIGKLRKKGFSPPVAQWLAGPLAELTRQTLSPDNLRPMGLFRPEYVTRLVDEHLARKRDHNRRLWALLVLVNWWERNR